MNRFIAVLCAVLSLAFMGQARADWFLSDAVKAQIVKADAGDVKAQFSVANAYDYGRGAPHDESEALKWYGKAAAQGDAEAQNSIGSIHQAHKRYAEALPWFEKASAQGHALATNNLAYLYDLGLGVTQDRQKGFELYSRAADLGWAEAMWNLANMYGAGQVGPVDFVTACAWTYRAERYATPENKILRAMLARAKPQFLKALSSEQLEACLKKSDEWAPGGAASTPEAAR